MIGAPDPNRNGQIVQHHTDRFPLAKSLHFHPKAHEEKQETGLPHYDEQ